MSKLSGNFYLFSFLPAVAYWYLESYYPLNIALLGGSILAIVEIIAEKLFTKHVHSLSLFNFFVIVVLGVISYFGQTGIWFKLQPFFTGMAIVIFILYKLKTSNGMMAEMMTAMSPKRALPIPVIRMLETHFMFFTLAYSLFMLLVAFKFSTSKWLFFKTAGFYISFLLFMIFEVIYLRRKARQNLPSIEIKYGKRF